MTVCTSPRPTSPIKHCSVPRVAAIFFIQDGRLVCAMCESSGEYRDGVWFAYQDSGRFTTRGFVEHFVGWLKPKVLEYSAQREHHRLLRETYKNIGVWIKKDE